MDAKMPGSQVCEIGMKETFSWLIVEFNAYLSFLIKYQAYISFSQFQDIYFSYCWLLYSTVTVKQSVQGWTGSEDSKGLRLPDF